MGNVGNLTIENVMLSVVPLCHNVSCFTPFMPLKILDGTEV
jgi:hypothetical protein